MSADRLFFRAEFDGYRADFSISSEKDISFKEFTTLAKSKCLAFGLNLNYYVRLNATTIKEVFTDVDVKFVCQFVKANYLAKKEASVVEIQIRNMDNRFDSSNFFTASGPLFSSAHFVPPVGNNCPHQLTTDKSAADEITQLRVTVAVLQEQLKSANEREKLKLENAELKLQVERAKLENMRKALQQSEFEYLRLVNKLHPRSVMERFEEKNSTLKQRSSFSRDKLWADVISQNADVQQATANWPYLHSQPIGTVAEELYNKDLTSNLIHDKHWGDEGTKVIIDKNILTPAQADLLVIICDLLPIGPDNVEVTEKVS